MARITVEDCLTSVDNLFDLVLLAAKRSRRLVNGAEALVDWENDKPTVVALREIAEGKITVDLLSEPDPEPEQEMIPENPLDLGVDFLAPRSSASGTDRERTRAMNYASSILGLLPGGRRAPGYRAARHQDRRLPPARPGRAGA